MMKKLSIGTQSKILFALTAFLLVIGFLVMHTLGNRSPIARAGLPQQSGVHDVIATTAPTATPTVHPDRRLAPTRSPIQFDALPTPKPGLGHAIGHILCNGVPQARQTVYLAVILEGKPLRVGATLTERSGRWFMPNLPPGTYTVFGELYRTAPRRMAGPWVIQANQTTDFGDLDSDLSFCD
jgi:hypothetical protein